METLAERCDVGAIFAAALEHRATEGPEAELQKHYKLAAHQVPLDLLETRAVTPAPSDVGQQQAPIIPGVFPQSVAAFLGVDMPRVGVGDSVFPVLTQNAEVKTPDESAEATETTGSFSADVLSPKRLQASFFYSREDRARFAGMDSALRENLSMALSDALDKQVVSGTNGLLTGTNLAAHDVSAVTTFAAYLSTLGFARGRRYVRAGRGRYPASSRRGDLRAHGQRLPGEQHRAKRPRAPYGDHRGAPRLGSCPGGFG